MNRYKTHYKPNPCGRTGFQSNYTTNLNDVTCISCLVKNMMKAYNKKGEIKMTLEEEVAELKRQIAGLKKWVWYPY